MALVGVHGHQRDYTPVLETRGWTLQEELLSRRMLNCGQHELAWTCLEATCTERQPEERDPRGRSGFRPPIKCALVTGDAGVEKLDKDQIFNCWLEAVQDYLRRELSQSQDKLAAILGVQVGIGRILEDIPMAGVWKAQFFAPSLLWWIKEQSDEGSGSRLHCPSWSWAAVSSPVEYVNHPNNLHFKNRPWTSHNEVQYYPKVISSDLDDHGSRSIDGSITVRCKLLRENDLDRCCERHLVPDFLNSTPKSKSGKEVVNYETHHDSEDAATVSDAWLMLIRTNMYVPDVKGRNYKFDIHTHLLRLQSTSALRYDFRRVGLVEARSWKNRWLERATEETVRLF